MLTPCPFVRFHVLIGTHCGLFWKCLWRLEGSAHTAFAPGFQRIGGESGVKRCDPFINTTKMDMIVHMNEKNVWQKEPSDDPASERLFPHVWVQRCPFVVSAEGQRITRTPTASLWNKHILRLLAGVVIHYPANFGKERCLVRCRDPESVQMSIWTFSLNGPILNTSWRPAAFHRYHVALQESRSSDCHRIWLNLFPLKITILQI